ncbi:D-glycero-beta-D-manno-heptose 1,7-bisphosphate 7-phosphatase [Candidatus Odyssella acanthamoebae]|uniref:D,D-heptose 1,7-bisphosphate phosphatase n=1 Tax=Candidatus Odyssella acanthamoebae TaxID=91604 RepID=A0A077AVV0_9PROT|nr:D-glycero-beta-D-manno-heptose 1,7-bisphosphate 7-phosphatase [Candidatus Paracaedibacter acanthamoebae]AIK97272.1 D,D-heptose 1,7-bisphosphate phosphatase [Candidatus Paracaedibacter acanthamoebae]
MSQNKALILDRDGVINHDYGYVSAPEQFHFIDGIFDLCQVALARGYLIIVITNQSGIARGYYSIEDFERLNEWMIAQFEIHSIPISHVHFCPHHPDSNLPEFAKSCDCRKPKAGLFHQAATDYNLDLTQSIAVGDKVRDMVAAQTAGVGTRILLSSLPCDAAQYMVQSHTEIIDLLKGQE